LIEDVTFHDEDLHFFVSDAMQGEKDDHSGLPRRRLVVPEFQREYVWPPNRAAKFIDSLSHFFSVGLGHRRRRRSALT
jgi:uncharacterized protein with ParB-like and HNH nuclease domain